MTKFLQKFDQLPKLSLGGELGGANINGKFAELTAPTRKRDLYLITFHPCQSVYRAASQLHRGCSKHIILSLEVDLPIKVENSIPLLSSGPYTNVLPRHRRVLELIYPSISYTAAFTQNSHYHIKIINILIHVISTL
jgi:hypothetical protein